MAVADTMLAATYARTGPAAEVLEVRDVPVPDPGPGEVRVRIAVSGVNPTDVKTRAGLTGAPAAPFQVPGQDGAGVIDAVGEGVDAGRVGERVWLLLGAHHGAWGTGAQHAVVPAWQAPALPDGASDELGASLGVPALTAHRCLTADGPIARRSVLVAGGAGAVGHAAIELARHLGAARVVATARSEPKREVARAAGADLVVDPGAPDAAAAIGDLVPEGIDRMVEVDLAADLDLDLAVLAPHGVITTYADPGDPAPRLGVRRLMTANAVLRFMLLYGVGRPALEAGIADVTAAAAAGALTTLELHRFGLGDVVAAHEAVERGVDGKVLLTPPA